MEKVPLRIAFSTLNNDLPIIKLSDLDSLIGDSGNLFFIKFWPFIMEKLKCALIENSNQDTSDFACFFALNSIKHIELLLCHAKMGLFAFVFVEKMGISGFEGFSSIFFSQKVYPLDCWFWESHRFDTSCPKGILLVFSNNCAKLSLFYYSLFCLLFFFAFL